MLAYRRLLPIVSLILCAILVPAALYARQKSQRLLYEKIPGSSRHSPDGTWWGYNQNKIVRFGDLVFTAVVENDANPTTKSRFAIYKKQGDRAWERGASFPTSRPGNLLIDSRGVLHAFVFDPVNIAVNDSLGSLEHYSFPDAAKGDITHSAHETVIGADGKTESVNIRVGSAIGEDDTMAVAFGLTKHHPRYTGQSEHAYLHRPDKGWTHLVAGEGLEHDWYYPFTLVGKDTVHLLPIQDDQGGPQGYNLYQKIAYFGYANGRWHMEILADLTAHPLAKTRDRLLEQSDFFADHRGAIHAVYKETLDPKNDWRVTRFVHLIKTTDSWQRSIITPNTREQINWIKLFEVDGRLYYLYTAWNSVFVGPADSKKMKKLVIPGNAHAIYPSIATRRDGTKDSGAFLDILLLTGERREYASSANYYVRLPKSLVRGWF